MHQLGLTLFLCFFAHVHKYWLTIEVPLNQCILPHRFVPHRSRHHCRIFCGTAKLLSLW